MLIIAFTWTTVAFEAGFKTCTRRSWSDEYAARFKKDMVIQAWDRGPRNGGHIKGLIQLTDKPYLENTGSMLEEDYENEGLGWMERQGMKIRGVPPHTFWENWKAADEVVYVVRYKKLEVKTGLFYALEVKEG